MTPHRILGAAAIGVAIAYNGAFAALARNFDYPDILRRPAAEVLNAFALGGSALVLTWAVLALSALAFIPVALGLALAGRRPDALPVSAAILGALAGVLQAVGLMRWVFAIPALAAAQESGREAAFLVLNQWGGVAIGEHLGQWLTALFLGTMALVLAREGARLRAGIAALAAAMIVVGAQEGLLLAIGRDPGWTPAIAVAGYVGLSLWLVAEGGVRLIPPAPTGMRPN